MTFMTSPPVAGEGRHVRSVRRSAWRARFRACPPRARVPADRSLYIAARWAAESAGPAGSGQASEVVGCRGAGYGRLLFAAAAPHCFAVDAEGVPKVLGAGATVLSALRPLQRMIDQHAVAVVEARPAVTAPCIHAPFLALDSDKSALPRPPAPAVQPQPHSCNRSSSIPK